MAIVLLCAKSENMGRNIKNKKAHGNKNLTAHRRFLEKNIHGDTEESLAPIVLHVSSEALRNVRMPQDFYQRLSTKIR